MSTIQNRGFRNTVLRSLVGLYRNLSIPDYVNMCQCLIFLEDPLSVAEILDKLAQGEEENELMAYQIAFDLYESATQQFLGSVMQALRATAPLPSVIEEKMKPKTVPEVTASSSEQPENKEAKPEVKEERTVDSLVSIFFLKHTPCFHSSFFYYRVKLKRNIKIELKNSTVSYQVKFSLSFIFSFLSDQIMLIF